MMNRRKFLKIAATTAIAPKCAGAAVDALPKYGINPAWVEASYETEFILTKEAFDLAVAMFRDSANTGAYDAARAAENANFAWRGYLQCRPGSTDA